jgi:hypothetical protein
MRRTIPALGALLFALLLAPIVCAQSTRIEGQVLDPQANPWPDVTVQIKNVDTSQEFTVKTDRTGHYSQLVPKGGIYEFVLTNDAAKLNFTERHSIMEGSPNNITFNFKDLIAQQKNSGAEEAKKAEEQANAFKNMKAHFDAGIAAINDSTQVRQQLATASADQKSALQDKTVKPLSPNSSRPSRAPVPKTRRTTL